MKRKAEAIWNEKAGRWCVKVQRNGTRKSFYSSVKGRKGKHEAENKADAWIESGKSDMGFETAWKLFMEYNNQRASRSALKKLNQYGGLYILPNIKNRKLSTITPIHWQACVDAGARKNLTQRSCANIRSAITQFARYAYKSRWELQRIEDGDIVIPSFASLPSKNRYCSRMQCACCSQIRISTITAKSASASTATRSSFSPQQVCAAESLRV